jgi:cystatin-C
MEVWKYRVLGSLAALLLLLAIVLPFTQTETKEASMADGALVGGIKEAPAGQDNDLHVVDLARYAVNEHNNKAVSPLEPLLLPSL